MKNKFLLLSLTVFISTLGWSQCADLFISEYVEGWSNNKAIEIYNPTTGTVDLSDYKICRHSNGNTYTSCIELDGLLDAYGTYVVVIDKRDSNGVDQEAPVWDDLQAKADTFVCPDYNVNSSMSFNGNDAVTLEKVSSSTIVDIFGKPGEDPGDSWTDEYPYNDAKGAYWTKDQTLIRKFTIQEGVTSTPTYFDPTSEWDSLSANTFEYLGCHVCDCDPNYAADTSCYKSATSIKDIKYNDYVYLFPNPTKGDLSIKATSVIQTVEIYNNNGSLLHRLFNPKKRGDMNFSLKGNSKGVYFVRVTLENGRTIIEKLVLQ